MAHKARVLTCVDTSGGAFVAALKAGPFMVKPNQKEAEGILRYRLDSAPRIKKAVKYFSSFGIQNVVISLGERGAAASDGKEIIQARPPRLKVQNSVGCGDSVVAGFIAARERGLDFKNTVGFAVACGAADALTVKPGEIRKAAVQKLAGKIKINIL